MGKFFHYPIRFRDVVKHLGYGFGISAGLSLMKELLFGKNIPIQNAEQAYIRKFGKVVYKTFFKNYTEKLWGIPCSELDGAWISIRSDNLSVWKIFKGFFVKVKDLESIDEFKYPRKGFGQFCDKMARRVIAEGVVIHLNSKLTGWEQRDGCIMLEFKSSSGEKTQLCAERVISTIPMDLMAKICLSPVPEFVMRSLNKIKFRDAVIVALHLNQEQYMPDNWMYTQNEGIDFIRIHEPKNWSPDMVTKNGSTVVVLEIPCQKEDCIWREDHESLARRLFQQLNDKIVPVRGDLIGYDVQTVRNVYPVYQVGYKEYAQDVINWLNRYGGLYLASRNGLFYYDNCDQPIESGMEAAERISFPIFS